MHSTHVGPRLLLLFLIIKGAVHSTAVPWIPPRKTKYPSWTVCPLQTQEVFVLLDVTRPRTRQALFVATESCHQCKGTLRYPQDLRLAYRTLTSCQFLPGTLPHINRLVPTSILTFESLMDRCRSAWLFRAHRCASHHCRQLQRGSPDGLRHFGTVRYFTGTPTSLLLPQTPFPPKKAPNRHDVGTLGAVKVLFATCRCFTDKSTSEYGTRLVDCPKKPASLARQCL